MRTFILLIFSFHLLGAQKVVKKSLINPEIDAINIDASKCFDLSIDTAAGNEMVIEATIDGEYKKDLLLNVKQDGHTILIGTGFQPNFKNPNDKLSAHKVISIALKIRLPEQKSVSVYGTNCNVTSQGNFRNLKITLSDGRCSLRAVSESTEVKTQSGDIFIHTKMAEIEAKSKYGKVRSDEISKGHHTYKINTVTGNIKIKKAE